MTANLAQRAARFPLGATITEADLADAPYSLLAQLREHEPVTWIPALGAWLVTRRDLAVQAMRDADTFTVDDPRFSTGAVIGQSMLSLDGPEHTRHRSAFAPHFKANVVREQFEERLTARAAALVDALAPRGRAELRTEVAGPMAVGTITDFLGLANADTQRVLEWYRHIADAIVAVTVGRPVSAAAAEAIHQIHDRVATTLESDTSSLLQGLEAEAVLRPEELATATAVVMFGAIETSEGMTANVLWHLLSHPDHLRAVQADPALLGATIEESLRLEPAAAVVDRYTTRDTVLGDVAIPKRDLVTISLLGANRDPHIFAEPDVYNPQRANLRQHVTFVQGPHGCLGLHLARLETHAAVAAVLSRLNGLRLDAPATTAPAGLIFRKPASVVAVWDT